jgi:hypothetical protein
MAWDDPRSTSSHCGSANALDHRVPVFPSTAFEAGKVAFSSEDAVAVLPWATFAVPQVAASAELAVSAVTSNPATRLSAATKAATTRLRARLRKVRLIIVLPPDCEMTCYKTYFKAQLN